VFPTSHFRSALMQKCRVPRVALLMLALVIAAQAMAVSTFEAQRRLGYHTGDQWEPAMASDSHGHIYVLYPQYGAVPDCATCTAPTIALAISNDNGLTWQASKPLLPFATGQFDPQIAVDPADRQTVYASWLQNNKRDVIVARSLDFGRTWSYSWAERGREDADKPVLAVRGPNVYVGFNHEENFVISASHDAGQTFATVVVNPNTPPGSSLAGGATIDPNGNVFFGWTAYAAHETSTRPVSIYVSRSSDGGNTWLTTLVDVSSAAPECEAQGCEEGYLGAQIALASDSSGALYALWNAGSVNGGPERIYFSSSTTGGASWSIRANVSTAAPGVEHCFPAIVAGASGDVRVAWMDARAFESGHPNHPLWNTFLRTSTNGGATWADEVQLSVFSADTSRGYDYILPTGFRFPFGDYFSIAIDSEGATHAVWGAGRNYKSPGSIWYTRGH
jgi:Neuraminidase (sialidase)